MLIRGVVHHHVHHHADVALACLGHEAIEISERAVLWIDVLVVGNVVAEIHVRRLIHRRKPDCIHAQLLEVVEPRSNPVQVADPVAIRVLKAARVYLVDHGILPPILFPSPAPRFVAVVVFFTGVVCPPAAIAVATSTKPAAHFRVHLNIPVPTIMWSPGSRNVPWAKTPQCAGSLRHLTVQPYRV